LIERSVYYFYKDQNAPFYRVKINREEIQVPIELCSLPSSKCSLDFSLGDA